MPITLLLDLDDTLLDTDVSRFLPAYYRALAEDLCDIVPQETLLAALRAGVERMMLSSDGTRTLQQVFDAEFFPRLAVDPETLRLRIGRFYRDVFPSLQRLTKPRKGARELVDWAMAAGHHLALATDPLFPVAATAERVRWAGLDPAQFELISTYESFHFTKTHTAYFAEVMGRLGWPDEPVVMAGDDAQRDTGAAAKLGLTTFEVHASSPRGNGMSGSLAELQSWLATNASTLRPPVFQSREAVTAVLEATPAAMQGLSMGLSAEAWALEASPDDWAMVELICHLRDTEREVHAAQITELLDAAVPFVARPDAAVWAKQRRYLSENGPRALSEFAAARKESLERLRSAPEDAWGKQARHAIFGPSTFLEVIGFMAEHDRLHLRQAVRTLEASRARAHRN